MQLRLRHVECCFLGCPAELQRELRCEAACHGEVLAELPERDFLLVVSPLRWVAIPGWNDAVIEVVCHLVDDEVGRVADTGAEGVTGVADTVVGEVASVADTGVGE
eukprot:4997175-Pyramimonas_sp.AAC.1